VVLDGKITLKRIRWWRVICHNVVKQQKNS